MKERKNTLQAVVDYLVDNGVTEFNVNILIHTNTPALGNEDANIARLAQEGEWNRIWDFVDLYIAGDLW